ncbi:hypothetical protein Q5P01_013753 [Channa striata]|uniref:Ubiquitin-like protease family profile domain-containing protein n=1 Tax=Channa striata TaxID=64152 RepID=A0AA88SJG5_CHASR|nr:hypothetical protein Q5P01_013753 [Channa striata]
MQMGTISSAHALPSIYVVRKIRASIAEGEQQEKPIITPCSAIAEIRAGRESRGTFSSAATASGPDERFLLYLTESWTMMEQRRALTLPFTVDKDNLMENPLKIPMTCLSSECGLLERQVSWTAIAGCKLRQNDSKPKNGSMHNCEAMVSLEMARRKPCLILKDVLKTEQGKTYMERIKQDNSLGGGGQMTSAQRESGWWRDEHLICKETRSTPRDAKNEKKCVTPKHNQKASPLPSSRQRLRRKLQTSDEEEDEDNEEIIIGKENGEDYKFSEVVDCGVSVSCGPADDSSDCEEFSPVNIDMCFQAKGQHSLKRKRKDEGSLCNGTGSPKHHRESVLRLIGEDGRDEGPAPASAFLEECVEDGDLGNPEQTILEFTVGGDDITDVLVPIISPKFKAGDITSISIGSLSPSQNNTTKISPSEPIVLSSDDEDSGDVPAAHTLVTVGDVAVQGQSSKEAPDKQKDSDVQGMEVVRVFVKDLVLDSGSVAAPSTSSAYFSCMGISFFTLHCGGYQGKANGDITVTCNKIMVPLKDSSEEVQMTLTIERKELRRCSVWEKEDMEAQKLHFNGNKEPSPAAVLFLCVSETAAAAIRSDLRELCGKQDKTTNTGKASPFILLTLKNPLEGIEGAFFRSLLDIDCLVNIPLSRECSTIEAHGPRTVDFLKEDSPVLSLDESIALVIRTALDPNLLSLLGLETPKPELNTDKEGFHSDRDKNAPAHVPLEVEPHKETVLELESTPEQDRGTHLNPDEDQKEQELEPPSDKKKEESTHLYTLCHRRSKTSYSVALCKPASNWTKYRHQGLACRLIQFPPPPLKGGITVTLEDLQCLDSGQFLNDVIIDFYLKYLLQNASASMAECSHIFSSFFYKQLTRRDNANEGTTSDSCQRQRRHQRVKTWTRHVDIFKKDFLFVPVNQEAHWYLVVICFPGLYEPNIEPWTRPDPQTAKCHSRTDEPQDQEEVQRSKRRNGDTETRPTLNRRDSTDTETENAQEEPTKDPPPGPVNCTERTCQKKAICKRPCILIMDSLKLSLHERVFKLLREYLQSEWEARQVPVRDFGPDQMTGSHCLVPLQDNSSDCGLYLLQYVESFLKDPVVHFDLPLHLERWFPRQQVRRKRDEIRDLVTALKPQELKTITQHKRHFQSLLDNFFFTQCLTYRKQFVLSQSITDFKHNSGTRNQPEICFNKLSKSISESV